MKTRHQLFVEELRRQYTHRGVKKTDTDKPQSDDTDENPSLDDLEKLLEEKFSELFGDPDED